MIHPFVGTPVYRKGPINSVLSVCVSVCNTVFSDLVVRMMLGDDIWKKVTESDFLENSGIQDLEC